MKVLDHGFVELIDSMPAPAGDGRFGPDFGPGDARIVEAARVSIAGEDVRPASDDRKLINYLLKNRHTTPFEQVRFTFRVKLPIFVARQWIRHRTGSFNEMSARYGKLPEEFYIPEPSRMQRQATNNKQGSAPELVEHPENMCIRLRHHSQDCYQLYEELLEGGLARELARMVLPLNFYTMWYWTTDLHNLMHFLTLRLHSHAQYEFRVYAEVIMDLVTPIAPCALTAFRDHVLKGS